MRIITEQNTFVSPINKYGKIENNQLIIFAKSGFSKGLILEGFTEWYQRHGFLVCIISDPKNEVEYGYQMFEPKEKYHLDHLKTISSIVGEWKLPKKHDVKIYHPFTMNLPTNRLLPKMNIFTIPIKSLGRNEWGLLSEVKGENETIAVLLKAVEDINNEEGLHQFIHKVESSTKSGKQKKRDWKNFGVEVNSGTSKELTKVVNNLRPFKEHYFLAKESCPYNLNWKDILTDQKNYHVFVSNYIGRKDEKVCDFLVLYLLESILRNKSYLKCPVLIVIPEISKLCPFKPEGHKEFLAESIKKNLKTMRSEGRGMSSLIDSQVFGDVDDDLKGSSTMQLFGELGDPKDVENLCKALGYGKSIKEQLSKAEVPRTYLVRGVDGAEIDEGGYLFFYPTAMHCEPEYNFEEMYREHHHKNPEEYPMMSCREISEYMKKTFKDEENKLKELIRRRDKEAEEEERKKIEDKESRREERENSDNKKETKKEITKEFDEKIQKLCYDMFNDPKLEKKEKSYRKIALKFGITHVTAKKYIDTYQIESVPSINPQS